jgi:hypothetical protein
LLLERKNFVDKLFTDVLDRFDVTIKEDSGIKEKSYRGIINPQIVLTQSFI